MIPYIEKSIANEVILPDGERKPVVWKIESAVCQYKMM